MTLLASVQMLSPNATQEQVDFFLGPIIAKAQPCLDNYPEDEQWQALSYLFAHMQQQANGGQVTSERTRTGAQRSFKELQGSGLQATQYGQFLANMSGAAECLRAVLDAGKRFAVSINPRRCAP